MLAFPPEFRTWALCTKQGEVLGDYTSLAAAQRANSLLTAQAVREGHLIPDTEIAVTSWMTAQDRDRALSVAPSVPFGWRTL